MIGKPHWFKRRKYAGWGVYPATWQGWVYLGLAMGLMAITQVLPFDEAVKIASTFILAMILVLDVLDIMRKMPMDERERIHEAIAERNALWVIIVALAAGTVYQSYISAAAKSFQVDPVIILALVAGLFAKAFTNIYLDKKD